MQARKQQSESLKSQSPGLRKRESKALRKQESALKKQLSSSKKQQSFSQRSLKSAKSGKSSKLKHKTNRTRKSQCQKDALWELYKQWKGKTPPREVITQLSEELNLSEQQVYKWFWDTKKKVDEDTQLAKQMGKNPAMLSDEFGGYSKTWKKDKEVIGVDGRDGHNNQLTPQQIKTALKINQLAAEREADFESIANQLGLDIEKLAYELVSAPSPTGNRQIVRRIKEGGSSKKTSFCAPTFSKLSMMNLPKFGSICSTKKPDDRQPIRQQSSLSRKPKRQASCASKSLQKGDVPKNQISRTSRNVDNFNLDNDEAFFHEEPSFGKDRGVTKGNYGQETGMKRQSSFAGSLMTSPAIGVNTPGVLTRQKSLKMGGINPTNWTMTFSNANDHYNQEQQHPIISPLIGRGRFDGQTPTNVINGIFNRDSTVLPSQKASGLLDTPNERQNDINPSPMLQRQYTNKSIDAIGQDQMAFLAMVKGGSSELGPPADSGGNTAKNENKKDNANGVYGNSNAYGESDLKSQISFSRLRSNNFDYASLLVNQDNNASNMPQLLNDQNSAVDYGSISPNNILNSTSRSINRGNFQLTPLNQQPRMFHFNTKGSSAFQPPQFGGIADR